MLINIKRFNPSTSESKVEQFDIKNTNLLQAFNEIKHEQDNSLTYRCGCKSGVCGSCAVRVNGEIGRAHV